MSTLLSLWTVFVGVVFLGVVVWTLSRSHDAEFNAAARIPLDDDVESDVKGEQRHG